MSINKGSELNFHSCRNRVWIRHRSTYLILTNQTMKWKNSDFSICSYNEAKIASNGSVSQISVVTDSTQHVRWFQRCRCTGWTAWSAKSCSAINNDVQQKQTIDLHNWDTFHVHQHFEWLAADLYWGVQWEFSIDFLSNHDRRPFHCLQFTQFKFKTCSRRRTYKAPIPFGPWN